MWACASTTVSRGLRRAALLASLLAAGGAAAAGLRAHVEDLARTHGFAVQNAERLGDEPARPSPEALRPALEVLLADYNYLVQQRPEGGIAKVLIVGRRRAPPQREPSNAVATRRSGAHHIVEAVLVGPNAAPRQVSMILDTGASTLVLPASMVAALGFEPDSLEPALVQTANGQVSAAVGRLRSVEVGGAVVADVTVTFVPDDRLSGQRLLGMSFLAHFRLTIDDANSRLILMHR